MQVVPAGPPAQESEHATVHRLHRQVSDGPQSASAAQFASQRGGDAGVEDEQDTQPTASHKEKRSRRQDVRCNRIVVSFVHARGDVKRFSGTSPRPCARYLKHSSRTRALCCGSLGLPPPSCYRISWARFSASLKIRASLPARILRRLVRLGRRSFPDATSKGRAVDVIRAPGGCLHIEERVSLLAFSSRLHHPI
jgi:hypothetical protein